jgi:hypothetical protein
MGGVVDPLATGDQDDGHVRIGRRRFLGGTLAAAGAALIPSAAPASAKSPPAAVSRGSSGPSAAAGAGGIPQVPLRDLYPNLPALPLDLPATIDTFERLEVREQQLRQAKQGLTEKFTINGVTRRAYAFLFREGTNAAQREARRALAASLRRHPERASMELRERLRRRDDDAASGRGTAAAFSLERPRQFSMSWTNFADVYETGLRRLPDWASSLTDAASASKQFWPMIARHGIGYNLIIPERVRGARASALREEFGAAWTREVRAALASGDLYVIDMSRFEALQPQTVNGAPRFTPATITLLTRNRRRKTLTPVAIVASGFQGAGRQLYSRSAATDGAWLYALQAAKASLTVFGVWLGHVYQWHIVTAAMHMTMLNTVPTSHPVRQLLEPQSNFVIPLDDVLLVDWSALAPPTSLTTPDGLLALANDYATGRSYFDDDPKTTIEQLGLRRRDFSVSEPWDRYPVVQRLLAIWDLVAAYVETFVGAAYASDAAVAADTDLATWIATAASADASTGGNIRGLPEMSSRAALERVLKSLLYRITVHGIQTLHSTANPALTFVPNFPHCLQRTDIPGPRARIGTRRLLSYLPNTETIGEAVDFYFTFVFSPPYVPFIPFGGVGEELFFPGGLGDRRNRALVELRQGLARFINDYQPGMPQRFQWPLNVEI